MKIKKLGALLVSAALCAGMAAPAFAFEGEAAPVEQPVLPEVVEEDVVTVTDETSGALTPEGKGDKKTKVLLPTDKGKALITVMPEQIQSADMTADWEAKLLRIERGEMEPEIFMMEINTMITALVENTEAAKGADVLMKNKMIGVCPNCGANVVEREKGWFCESNPCRFVLWKDNAFFKRLGKRMDAHVADKLLRDGRIRLKDCKSTKGKVYNATVLLSTEADGRSKFSLEFEDGR